MAERSVSVDRSLYRPYPFLDYLRKMEMCKKCDEKKKAEDAKRGK